MTILFDQDTLPVDARVSHLASMDSWDCLMAFTIEEVDRSMLSASKKYGMKLAIEEIISNIIRANSAGSNSGSDLFLEIVRFAVPSEEPSLFVQIKDNGFPFDPHFEDLDEQVIDSPLHERPIGGLGLLLVKKSVDSIAYRYQDSCNVYRLFSSEISNPSI
jgi:anti-sigma regulatory factor (Ser/Thr protein kinase)